MRLRTLIGTPEDWEQRGALRSVLVLVSPEACPVPGAVQPRTAAMDLLRNERGH
jgi:hypothetical protein